MFFYIFGCIWFYFRHMKKIQKMAVVKDVHIHCKNVGKRVWYYAK